MRRFYAEVDCLVHAPLTEAFGLVAIEAAAHGCPVVTVAVDGLPEAVADGVSGTCLAASLPLRDYPRLGGALDGIPRYVYDPRGDALREPGIVDPAALAAAVRVLATEPGTFERMSRTAAEHVAHGFDFAAHVDLVMDSIASVAPAVAANGAVARA
jgi:glycosyltransferase involved in cell wall biosynthesis